jgi:hypothetical protein
VSRLFTGSGLPIAFRVLIADAARTGFGTVLPLSPFTRLKGRGDTTRAHRQGVSRSYLRVPRV